MKRSLGSNLRHGLRVTGQGLLFAILLAGFVPAPLLSRPGPTALGAVAPRQDTQVGQAGPPAPSSPATDLQPLASDLRSPDAGLTSAYVRDVDLGNGRREATISTTPINYQAEDGSWQPIDPRFEVVDGGFLNKTNSLVIGAAPSRAMLRLRQGQNMLLWEPQAVALAAADGTQLELARPLDDTQAAQGTLSGDGRTIRYQGSWTIPALSDEVTAGPGQVEQSLVVSERPAGQGEYLALRATLSLFPGMQLYADGAVQNTALTTAGLVELRDAQGQTVLVLAPPRAFEQAHPGTGVAGRYRLEPQPDGRWEVVVETPWSWWSDPVRAYPVVLDPTMYVLKATEIADIYSAWPNGCSDPPVPPQQGEYEGPTVGVGQTPDCGTMRTLLRFNSFPTLPPGYQIEEALLDIVPVRGYYPVMNLPQGPFQNSALVNVSLYQIVDGESWDPSTVNWENQPAVYSDPFLTYFLGDPEGYFSIAPPVLE